MKRRSFLLGGGAALLAAPAVVQASSLMKLWVPPESELVAYTPTFVGFGTVGRVTVMLPPVGSMVAGRVFTIVNNSQSDVAVKSEDDTAFLNPGSKLTAEYPKELS